jgi:hypothetical protein
MKAKMVLAAGLLVTANAAYAEEMLFKARVGPTLGVYQQEFSFSFRDPTTGAVLVDPDSGQELAASFDADEFAWGLQAGVGALYGDFFADLGVEFLAVDADDADLDRTDVLLTAGYFVGQYGQVFGGYRKGMQGSGFFDDDTFSEDGFFVGVGLGGMSMGELVVGASLAYNLSKAKDFPIDGQEFDYDGFSLKLSGQLKSMPQHSLQLRFQQFSGDSTTDLDFDGDAVADARLEVDDLTETYVQLTYFYSF